MHRSFIADEQKAAKVEKGMEKGVEKGVENVDIESTQPIYRGGGAFRFFCTYFLLTSWKLGLAWIRFFAR